MGELLYACFYKITAHRAIPSATDSRCLAKTQHPRHEVRWAHQSRHQSADRPQRVLSTRCLLRFSPVAQRTPRASSIMSLSSLPLERLSALSFSLRLFWAGPQTLIEKGTATSYHPRRHKPCSSSLSRSSRCWRYWDRRSDFRWGGRSQTRVA